MVKLTQMVNSHFGKSFPEPVIRHQVRKIKAEKLGIASADAQELVKLLTEDSQQRKYFFHVEYSEHHQLRNVCFMTEKMVTLANEFSDILIIDATHKTNRFNLPLLDIIAIDHLGRSCTCFIALLEDQTEKSFLWALKEQPNVIMSDEENALISAIKNTFPQSRNYICAWHAQKNIKKRCFYLNKGNDEKKKGLYKLLINLPFSEYESEYLEKYETIKKSDVITKDLKQFLESRHNIRNKWVKCFMKQTFTCGTCTSSRIESKHRIYKIYLDGNSRLCEVFRVFKDLEDKQFSYYKDEIKKLTQSQENEINKHELIKRLLKDYSPYIVKKMQGVVLESIHYAVQEIKKGAKW